MKAYIIHKFEDKVPVTRMLDELLEQCAFEPVLFTESPIKHWRRHARKKIKEADCAIYFLGRNGEGESVDWELTCFIKQDKPIYVVKLDESYQLNQVLYRKSKFGNVPSAMRKRTTYCKVLDLRKLAKIINNQLELDLSEEIISHSDMDPEVSIEQYKAYLQTSEDVVSRRQSVSNFYITVNATLLSITSTLITILNLLKSDYSPYIMAACCLFLPIIGVILCLNWRRLVYSYGQLNAAKMKVISAIEKNLPFNIYDVEWQVQTDRLGKKRYVSFTNIEKLIPFLFIILYSAVFLAGAVVMILQFI